MLGGPSPKHERLSVRTSLRFVFFLINTIIWVAPRSISNACLDVDIQTVNLELELTFLNHVVWMSLELRDGIEACTSTTEISSRGTLFFHWRFVTRRCQQCEFNEPGERTACIKPLTLAVYKIQPPVLTVYVHCGSLYAAWRFAQGHQPCQLSINTGGLHKRTACVVRFQRRFV